MLKDRQKGEVAWKNWLNSKKVIPKNQDPDLASERLYALAEQRRLKQERTNKEKQQFEADEIENLAHIHADKHIVQDNVRSVEQFMQDQIHFE